ncbi:hypothetical protein OC844_007959, partial [Tilletia horrida]
MSTPGTPRTASDAAAPDHASAEILGQAGLIFLPEVRAIVCQGCKVALGTKTAKRHLEQAHPSISSETLHRLPQLFRTLNAADPAKLPIPAAISSPNPYLGIGRTGGDS